MAYSTALERIDIIISQNYLIELGDAREVQPGQVLPYPFTMKVRRMDTVPTSGECPPNRRACGATPRRAVRVALVLAGRPTDLPQNSHRCNGKSSQCELPGKLRKNLTLRRCSAQNGTQSTAADGTLRHSVGPFDRTHPSVGSPEGLSR